MDRECALSGRALMRIKFWTSVDRPTVTFMDHLSLWFNKRCSMEKVPCPFCICGENLEQTIIAVDSILSLF